MLILRASGFVWHSAIPRDRVTSLHVTLFPNSVDDGTVLCHRRFSCVLVRKVAKAHLSAEQDIYETNYKFISKPNIDKQNCSVFRVIFHKKSNHTSLFSYSVPEFIFLKVQSSFVYYSRVRILHV